MVRGSLLRRWFGSDQTSSCLASDEIPRFLTRYGNLEATMASGLPGVAVLALCVVLSPCVYGDRCSDNNWWLSEEEKEECKYKNFSHGPAPMVIGFVISVIVMLIFICCCVCPCCCLYKMCRKPRPVIATTTHTTVVTGTPHPYPQQQAVMPVPSQSYQAVQYPAYQPVPVQPGYPAQPMPTSPYQGQQFTPPPTYQEATGPAHPLNRCLTARLRTAPASQRTLHSLPSSHSPTLHPLTQTSSPSLRTTPNMLHRHPRPDSGAQRRALGLKRAATFSNLAELEI
ncbi:protein shisa-4-like isoform X1 [Acanthochromis polyacanthus]|uniref:protein shisa-4-like isoform X1 n=1 Tax=Acanthochromis polyacanthus TaxID=80966 RepID=UPI0022344111|nr:protein shisa-4-like isoform X1 [Acanthochromis polyacanthus]